ncbi:hypothetical protein QZH41_017567, partial [Actinostola sp. cb2023]
ATVLKTGVYLDPRVNKTVDFYPFVGYSPNMTVEGDLVYVNYGTTPDYEELEKMNITVKGKIVMSRSVLIPQFNMTLKTGPGFHNDTLKIKLKVNTQINSTSIYNVIGTITGSEEPDRDVIVGNHWDSWVFGAADALSGASTTHEIARVLGLLRKSGWRPRRTIKICSWGGEEWGLFG